MKRLALFCALALTSCAVPALAPREAVPEPVVVQADPAAATLTVTKGTGFDTLRFAAGTEDAPTVELRLYGATLALNTPLCTVQGAGTVGAHVLCDLGGLKAGTAYALPVRGLQRAEARYNRADGTVYRLTTSNP